MTESDPVDRLSVSIAVHGPHPSRRRTLTHNAGQPIVIAAARRLNPSTSSSVPPRSTTTAGINWPC
jgi:hypothetical protein